MSYANGSRVDIARSEIGYLGFDATTAYGLSWRSGSTGSVVDSDVHHNFFGLYSYEAVDLEVRNNVFRNNVFYGIDPHDYSSGLTISSNETYGNGSHGIIFSQGVVNSVVRDNYSHDNGSNGIVMDDESNENVVAHNVVEHNEGDGIVILGSSRVLVRDNDVRDNRVGIRVNYVSGDNVIRGNRIEGNVRGVEVYGGARETQLSANRIARSSSSGMILEAPASRSIGDVVTGTPVGIEVRSLAEIRQTQIRDVDRGIVVTPRGIVDMRRLQVQATDIGLELAPTALGRLDYSSVEAAEPVSGKLRYAIRNDLITPLPVPWLAIAGAGFLSAAVGLELMHWARNKVLLSSVAIPPAFKNGR
jgi:parallel beta-helix repeat protein